MKISIWSDFVCPFCYIGGANLDKALKNFAHSDEVEIEYKSFQLDPEASYDPSKSYIEGLAAKKGVSVEEMQQSVNQIDAMAKTAGLDYQFDIMKNGDTFLAHRVFQYAKEQGKGNEYYARWYPAIFTEGALVSDEDTIIRISSEIGLDADEVSAILADPERYKEETVNDVFQAGQIGVQGVPFFVFDEKYAIPGAQPQEVFDQVLEQVYSGTVETD